MVTLLLLAVAAAMSVAEAGLVSIQHAPAAAIVPAATVYAAPAPAAALVRTPSLDSAVVHSERVGGNFAYSTVEGHAYTALTPVVHHAPVAVAYKAPQPVIAPLPVLHAAAAPLPAVYAPAKTFYYAH